jgi:hypothetical protein
MSATEQPNSSQASKSSNASDVMAYRRAQVAATLMAQRLQHFQNGGLPRDLSDPAWDLEFEGASKRADMMIRSALKRDHDVHAYQVFKEGQVFTAEEIADELKSVGWKGLSSKIPVEKLLGSLKNQMEGHFGDMSHEGFPNVVPAVRRFMGVIKWLRKDSCLLRSYPSLKDAVDSFIATALYGGAKANSVMSAGEFYFESLSNNKFLKWCFPVEISGSNEVRRYRPHEIFRFACQHEWCSRELTYHLSKLEPDFTPYPEKGILLSKFAAFDMQFSLSCSDLADTRGDVEESDEVRDAPDEDVLHG